MAFGFVHTTWNGWQNTASSWIHKAAHRPGRQRQRLPDQQPENLCCGDIVRGSDLVVTAIAEGRKRQTVL